MSTALIAPNVAGYPFDQAPDLTNAVEREHLSASAIKVFVNIAAKWGLNEAKRGACSVASPLPPTTHGRRSLAAKSSTKTRW